MNLRNDVIFKAVYAREDEDCKQALIAVLNLILNRTKDPITAITYRNPFNTREYPDEKEGILDIKAETGQHELLDLEIHLLYDSFFINRNLSYHGKMVSQALEIGEDYDKMKKTISIYITDFSPFPQTSQFHCSFALMEVTEQFLLTDLLQMHYLQLPKVNPHRQKSVEELSELQRYLEYLRYAGDITHSAYVEQLKSQGGKEITMTDTLLKKVTADEIVREKALAREKFLMQQRHQQQDMRRAQEQLEQTQTILEQTKTDLKEAQFELEDTQSELKNTQSELKDTQSELEGTQSELKDTQSELEGTQSELKDTQSELKGTQSQLDQTLTELKQTEAAYNLREQELAQNLKSNGMLPEQIAAVMKLSLSQVQTYLHI